MTIGLRPYQLAAVDQIRAEFGPGKKNAVLFVLPTGGGKTYTFSYITDGAAARGNRVLILEHRKELIRQCSLSLAALGVRHRIIAPSDKVAEIRRAHIEKFGWPMIDDAATVAVASIQTLARRIDWLQMFRPRLLIIDEAHHAVAGTWARVIKALPDAKLLGVTATPCRTDGRGLGDVFDSMVLGPTMGELIEQGALVPARVLSPPSMVDLSRVGRKDGDLDKKDLEKEVDKPHITGSAVDHYRRVAPGRPAIAFCVSVKHAEHVAEAFRADGWRFEIVIGDMDDLERDRRIGSLADGRLHGIVTVDVVSEGVDIPVAEVAILLRPTESESLFLQQVGRVLRPAEGKEYGVVLDHVGNIGQVVKGVFKPKHGLPAADREWSLEGRARRAKGPGDNEPPVRVIQCGKCFAAFTPAPACPFCGHPVPAASAMPAQRDGELVEITEADMVAEQARRAQGAARTMAQLKAIGMSEARAAHVLAARKEKEALQNELRALVEQFIETGGEYPVESIRDLKPKQLRDEIERLRSELGHIEFMGGEVATA